MKFILIGILLFSIINVNGQIDTSRKYECIQGLWECTENSKVEKSFSIIKKKLSISFVFDNSGKLNFPLFESIEGFQNKNCDNSKKINIKSLKSIGTYYTIVDVNNILDDGWVDSYNYFVIDEMGCDDETMYISGNKLVEFSRIDILPSNAIRMLYKRGLVDKIDYIEKYLNAKCAEITVNKCKIYKIPNIKSKMNFVKGDIVIISEETSKWLKVKYKGKKIVTGWIKKSDTNFK